MKSWISNLLQHPLTRGMDVDHPQTTNLRRKLIRNKPFLERIYFEWYQDIEKYIPPGDGLVVELGSGPGFLKEVVPQAITTDVMPIEGVDLVIPTDGQLPFLDRSLKALVMTDVLHHMNNCRTFFNEASRVTRKGGAIIMIEPWVTPWSRFVYRYLHSEPFRPEAERWELPVQGPLSGANGALPWILFCRDRSQFQIEFPEWELKLIKPMMPFVYILSGGISKRSFAPGWIYRFCRRVEQRISCINNFSAMFSLCFLVRK